MNGSLCKRQGRSIPNDREPRVLSGDGCADLYGLPKASSHRTPTVDFDRALTVKLAIGRKSECIAICKAMVASGILPDFITVDGG